VIGGVHSLKDLRVFSTPINLLAVGIVLDLCDANIVSLPSGGKLPVFVLLDW
jgi:hypothetical protein